MITVYSPTMTDYTTNGLAVLEPISCEVTAEAGGRYELDMELPKDDAGKWRIASQNGYIVKCPVPGGVTEIAIEGDNAEIWRIKPDYSSRAPLRSQPIESVPVTYDAWQTNFPYSVGSKVTYNSRNYELYSPLTNNTERVTVPPLLPGRWKEIANTKPGAPAIDYLSPGTEFYLIDVYSVWFLHVQTKGGVEGYVASGACEYVRTIDVRDIEPRTITEQLFRIKTVNATGRKTVKLWAQHVSYDHAGVEAGECVITNAAPASAIARYKNALLWEPNCTIATNLKPEDGTFSATLTKKNMISALLDPDTGIVAKYKARLIRDNWDFFIYRNTDKKSPVEIRYGGNLVSIKAKRDTSKLYTRIRPIAKQADGKTDLYLDGETPWIDSPLLDDYPVITMLDVELDAKVGDDDGNGGKWTETSLRDYMLAKAQEKLDVDNVDKAIITVQVEFVDLGDTAEYPQYKNTQRLHMYDTVRVVCEPDDIDMELYVTGYRWDAVRERYTSVTFANAYSYAARAVAGFMIGNGAIELNKLAPSIRDKLS